MRDRSHAGVVLLGRVADQQAGGLHARRHLRELVRDRLEPRQRPAERMPLLDVRDGGIEGRLRHADGESADARPEEIERVHRHAEAVVDVAEHLLGCDRNAVEVEAADRMRREQLEGLAGEPLALARDDERGDPSRAAVGGAREDAVDVGLGRVRDPDLRAGEPEAASALALCPQRQVRRVRAGLGLAERERGDGLAAREPRDPLVAQLPVAPRLRIG